ncbi:RNA polymerase alpha subunit C-terminal domain-containing protein [Ohtaekwangia koreensis]|uniref:RNA polymerase, alpha chain C terminal domain n=1 Tax=Ohtaekwangia koreensis TaxID=688867 RepID=A0A1T5L8C8_9BACT|nr:RNA polymerase alpha subunit C-terminal domain-containing protein [Ohtaekwangia koreensis]SKC72203.1 hypothetical protein SAMN05660236_2736 [Ohtaekwangia koreensis]
MATLKKNLRVCKAGHTYYKSSDCPTCPVCEQERKPAAGFLSTISAPTRRALEAAGIKTLHQLSQWSESDILKLHGVGPSSIPKLRKALYAEKLTFSKSKSD